MFTQQNKTSLCSYVNVTRAEKKIKSTCPLGQDILVFTCPHLNITVEPLFNEPLFNGVLDIMNDILCPGQSYRKMYGIKP